jgi:hypothetical protein
MMKQNPIEIPSFFGDPRITPKGILDGRTRNTPVEYREAFINNLGVPVTMLWRNGLKFVLPPEPDINHNTLVIRVFITVRASAYRGVVDFLSQLADNATPELKVFQEAFTISANGNFWQGGEVVLDYAVSLTQLKELGGTVYFSEVDKVLSLEPVSEHISHPYSDEGRKHQVLMENPLELDEQGFGFSVQMVDNAGLCGLRYLNISKQVYKVTPKKDIRKRDGIYIVSNHSMSSKGGNGEFETRYYSFESAEDVLGLWRTYEDALYSGDLSLANKKELARLEQNVAEMRLEKQGVEQKHALELIERDKELKRVTALAEEESARVAKERAEFEYKESVKRQELKDHFEERSHVRKDQSEGLKFLPTLLVGLGAIFAALKLV